jgi:ATP-binding cassette subfamily B protein
VEGLAIVLFFGGMQVVRGRLSPGDLVVFTTYLKNAFRPAREYAKYTARLARASAAGERVLAVLEEEATVRDTPGAMAAPPFRGEVAFEGVCFGYGYGAVAALNGLSFRIAPGTRVAVTGPSGAGKSTLASLLLRLYDSDEGRVLVDGRDVREFTLKSLRGQVGLVPQETLIFQGSFAEKIALGAGREVGEAEIEAAARLASIHDFIAAQPDGYATEIAERGATLSAGQRQRIAIARAALRDCPILVLDEPVCTVLRCEHRRACALGPSAAGVRPGGGGEWR